MPVAGIGAIVDHSRKAAGGSLPGVDAEFDDRCADDGFAIDRAKVRRSPTPINKLVDYKLFV